MTLHLTCLLTVSFSVVAKYLCVVGHCIIIEIQPAGHNATTPMHREKMHRSKIRTETCEYVFLDAVVGSPTNALLWY